jgi:hypothetical protein
MEGVAEPLIVSCCWNWRIRPATGSSARRYGGCHGPILTLQVEPDELLELKRQFDVGTWLNLLAQRYERRA